jgi:hypothetical protein
MTRIALAALVVIAALASAAPATAATFSFSRTDYVIGSWTSGQQVSQAGSGTGLQDKPLALADFNGDGKPDIAVSDYEPDRVHILLNNGSGGFAEASGSPFSVCHSPDSLLAGDFNADGKQDLLVDCSTEDAIIGFYPGDGAGGLGALAGSLTGFGPMVRASVLGGDDDIVYNRHTGVVSVCYVPTVTFKSSGSRDGDAACPSQTAPLADTGQWAAAVHWYTSDCGGDEFLGFGYGDPGGNEKMIVLALGQNGGICNGWETGSRDSGIFVSNSTTDPSGITTADLDKDGSADIVMSGSGGFFTIAGWNSVTGVGMVTNNIPSAGPITSSAVSDMDGDGLPDLVGLAASTNHDKNVVAIHPNAGGVGAFGPFQSIPTFGDQQNYSDDPRIAVADLNGDARPDIVAVASGGNNGASSTSWTNDVSVLLNTTGPSTGGGPTGGGSNPPAGGGSNPPAGGGSNSPVPFHGVTLHPQTLTVKRGAIHVAGTCPPDALVQCVGTDTLTTIKAVSVRVEPKRKKILKLGSAHFSIPAGHTASIKIKLSKQALKLLAKAHPLRVRETVVAHDQSAVSKTSRTTLTLKLAKKKPR